MPKLSKRFFSSQAKADDSTFNWTAFKIASVSVFSTMVTGLSIYVASKEVVKDVSDLFPESIPPALEKARVTSSAAEAEYVCRPDVEAKINNYLDSKSTSYCVIYGAKGVGKSEVVNHTAIGRRAVVKVTVTSVGNQDDLVALIMLKLTGKKISLDIDLLVDIFKKCKANGFIPTIIFDVERSKSAQPVLQIVRGLAKALGGYCRCIIVLSEANAVLEFGKDKHREKFIFVDEMTESEARQLLEVRGARFSEEEMRYIFESIGTSPVALIDLMSEVPKTPLKDYVARILLDSRRNLGSFKLKPILKALKEHPEGVDSTNFENMKYEGIDMSDLSEVGPVMKKSDAIIYRIENGKYQLLSTAHKTALKTYTPGKSNPTT